MPRLTVTAPAVEPYELVVVAGTVTTAGRRSTHPFSLRVEPTSDAANFEKSARVSSDHLRLRAGAKAFEVEDLQSRNGTQLVRAGATHQVRGVEQLADGDIVRVGEVLALGVTTNCTPNPNWLRLQRAHNLPNRSYVLVATEAVAEDTADALIRLGDFQEPVKPRRAFDLGRESEQRPRASGRRSLDLGSDDAPEPRAATRLRLINNGGEVCLVAEGAGDVRFDGMPAPRGAMVPLLSIGYILIGSTRIDVARDR